MFRPKLFVAALAAVMTMTMGAAVQAATCNPADVQHSSACIGLSPILTPPMGSASEDELAALDGGGWTFVGKEDDSTSSAAFDIALGTTSGLYTLFSPLAGFDYALALKGGSGRGTNFFAAYLLTAADIAANLVGGNLTGTFNMNAFAGLVGAGNTPGLSNAVLFRREAVAPIPLPAAGWLLLAALGGLAVMRRRAA